MKTKNRQDPTFSRMVGSEKVGSFFITLKHDNHEIRNFSTLYDHTCRTFMV